MINNIIRNDLEPPSLNDSAINTLAIMEEYRLLDVPIIDDKKKFLGLIQESSIMNMENIQESLRFIQKKLKNISIYSDGHVFQSLSIFHDHEVSIIPVIDKNDKYIGYLKPLDIITNLSMAHSNTSIIVLSINQKDYTLSEISRLIEENNGKIISLWTNLNNNKLEIHLLINCRNTIVITKSLQRHGYLINTTFSHETTPSNLDERFESFIKYLNT